MTFLSSCGDVKKPSGRFNIMTTIFPYYDFARQIAGNKAEVSMLLPVGGEAHDFEPSPKDIVNISECDLFVYNGGESEEWVEDMLDSVDSDVKVSCMFDVADLRYEEDINHQKGDEYDEHIWTSPKNAIKCVKAISDAMIELDPEYADYYKKRTENLLNKLGKLNSDFMSAVENSAHKPMVVADRFPLLYFAREYGIDFESAFPGCTSETQPSIRTVTKLIDFVRDKKIPVVFHIDNSSDSLARVICEDSDAEIRTFYSLHNVTKKQFDDGCTYISLMELNLKNLKEALC